MKIQINDDIKNFIRNVDYNIINRMNHDEAIQVTSQNEEELLRRMQEHDESIESIYLDERLVLDNPYYKNINLENMNRDDFSFKNEFLKKKLALNVSWILPDKKRELDDYIILGCFKKGINIPMLKEGDKIWMSPTLAEQNTINPCVDKAHGHVLTFGLGIGYFPYMCSLKDNVKSITIVELNENVIDMFKECILPQFNSDIEINIIHGNMFDYYNEEFLNKFDYIFVDVWEDNESGAAILEKLHEQYLYTKDNIDYWIEFSCLLSNRMLMYLYFNKIAHNKYSDLLSDFKDSEDDRNFIIKVHRYFRKIDKTVENPDELKDYLYDIKLMREIMSTKL